MSISAILSAVWIGSQNAAPVKKRVETNIEKVERAARNYEKKMLVMCDRCEAIVRRKDGSIDYEKLPHECHVACAHPCDKKGR